MTTKIFLIRHGQTASNVSGYAMGWSDEDLDADGMAQVRSLALRLAHQPVSSVYTSPMQRARTTALAMANPHGLEPHILEDLAEIRLGEWQGLNMKEIAQKWPELWRRWRTDPSDTVLPGGESFMQVVERSVRAFHRILADEHEKQVLLVTHEIVVKILAVYALGAPYNIYRRFEINNASLSVVDIRETRMRLITLNDTAHLAPSEH